MKAGPKAAVDGSPLPFRSRPRGARRFSAFCRQYVVVPKGKGALKPLRLRPWQTDLVGSVLDPAPLTSLAGWMLPRGQGKSALVAALGLYDLMLGAEGASVVVVATDERQAGIVFGAAARMVELHPELECRVQVYQDRLLVPARGATFAAFSSPGSFLRRRDRWRVAQVGEHILGCGRRRTCPAHWRRWSGWPDGGGRWKRRSRPARA